MIIFLRTITGKVYSLDMEPSDTVLILKTKFQDKTGIPVRVQRTIYSGRLLEDSRTLADYNIARDSTLHVVLCLRLPDPPLPTPVDQTVPSPQIFLHHRG
eukprot:INCI6892.1.p1 GENE.INCI6892.1~~INCI6892.1.p1  ORF type:complete len:100 (-),score=5.77 INCI6892.1:46-345(-)